MSEQCEHGNIGLCGLCILGVQKSSKANVISLSKPAEQRKREPRGFPAGYDSVCPACGSDIFEGDEITGSDIGWVHLDCWEDA